MMLTLVIVKRALHVEEHALDYITCFTRLCVAYFDMWLKIYRCFGLSEIQDVFMGKSLRQIA